MQGLYGIEASPLFQALTAVGIGKRFLGPRDQPVPHLAPPMLVDNASREAMAEIPAICFWLSERSDLLPAEPHPRAVALKIVNDANDVLDEMTLDSGKAIRQRCGEP